jgi:phosphoribosyl 1,2-cyclic phosphate phosphodiesterase
VDVVPVPVFHGPRTILGFRFGTFAYLTDCNHIPAESLALLDGLEVLVLDALRHRPHPTHFTVAQALDVVARLKPRRTLFTHMCHDLPHAATNAALPEGVTLAYDRQQIDVDVRGGSP